MTPTVDTAEMADMPVRSATPNLWSRGIASHSALSRAGRRVLLLAVTGYALASVAVLAFSTGAGASDAATGPTARALTTIAFGTLVGSACFAVDRPGRPLAAVVALTVVWDGADWAGATSTPLPWRLLALTSPLVLVVALLDAAVRWAGRPGRATRRTVLGLWVVAALVVGGHLLAYDPFDDPWCRLTCLPASLPWADHPSVTHLVSVVGGLTVPVLGLVAAVLLAVGAAKAGAARWSSAGAVLTAAAVAEVVVAGGAVAATVASPDVSTPWPPLFALRALAVAGVGTAMLATGALALRATRAVRRLGDRLVEPAELAGSLGRALHDPHLSVAYWYPDGQSWVDAAGQPVTGPDPGSTWTTLARAGDVVARLEHGARRPPPGDLDQALGPATLLAIDNARLAAVAQARLADIRSSRQRIVAGGDAERRRLERDLHDGAQQRLVSVALMLRLARAESDDPVAGTRLQAAEERARAINAELRDIAHGIFPAVLAEEGLAAAVFALVEAASVPVVVETVPDRRYDADIEMAAYSVLDEAVQAAAPGRGRPVRVRAGEVDGQLCVQATDDGSPAVTEGRRTALVAVEDRVGAVGGVFSVLRTATGGTQVQAVIPLPRHVVPAPRER